MWAIFQYKKINLFGHSLFVQHFLIFLSGQKKTFLEQKKIDSFGVRIWKKNSGGLKNECLTLKKNEAHWFAVFIPILAILYDWKKKLKQKTAFRVIVLI